MTDFLYLGDLVSPLYYIMPFTLKIQSNNSFCNNDTVCRQHHGTEDLDDKYFIMVTVMLTNLKE